MNRLTQTRLASGKSAGRLQLTVRVELDEADELAIARAIKREKEARVNLDQRIRTRGVGPCADAALNAMWNGLVDLIDRGRYALHTPEEKR